MSKDKPEVPRMSFEAFNFFKKAIDDARKGLTQNYNTSNMFYKDASTKYKNKAYEVWIKAQEQLTEFEQQLKYAAKLTHKDNSNVEMRHFWELQQHE